MIATVIYPARRRYLVPTCSGSLHDIDLGEFTLRWKRSLDDPSQHTSTRRPERGACRTPGMHGRAKKDRELDLRQECVFSNTRVSPPVIAITAAPNIDMTFIDLRSGGTNV